MICENILETIGKTPLVRLAKIAPNLYGKAEFFNPGGSVKDRIALNMIEDAEKKGLLKPGMTIVEPTSGNTGIGLALVAAVKGYKTVFTMPDSLSIERRKLLKQYGANLILTPGSEGMKGSIDHAQKLVDEKGYFMVQQFKNMANPEAHIKNTSREILSDLSHIDYFIAGVGTGGTVSGVGKVLKENIPGVKIIAVEPMGSPVISGGKPGPHKIQGIGAGFVPDTFDRGVVDEVVRVKAGPAMDMSRRLAKEEGILVGISAGANVHVASRYAKEEKVVVTILCDTGERYLSTELFGGE